jgi:hypothetical protein
MAMTFTQPGVPAGGEYAAYSHAQGEGGRSSPMTSIKSFSIITAQVSSSGSSGLLFLL